MKQLLEDRWKSLRQQLKERSPLYQADEAAAMRRWGTDNSGGVGGRVGSAPTSRSCALGEWLIPPDHPTVAVTESESLKSPSSLGRFLLWRRKGGEGDHRDGDAPTVSSAESAPRGLVHGRLESQGFHYWPPEGPRGLHRASVSGPLKPRWLWVRTGGAGWAPQSCLAGRGAKAFCVRPLSHSRPSGQCTHPLRVSHSSQAALGTFPLPLL